MDRDGPYWVISTTGLLDLLYRVQDGEDPDMIVAEEYANTPYTDVRATPRWKIVVRKVKELCRG